MSEEVSLTSRHEFSAAHYYRVSEWSDEKNWETFHQEANPLGHGHNYLIEVTLKGTVDPKTGMVINIRDLKAIVNQVLEEVDHHHLNVEIPFFKDRLPTPENLSYYLWLQISKKIPTGKVEKVRVYEDESLYTEYRGEQIQT